MGEIDAESGNGFSFDLEPNANPGWDSRDSETDFELDDFEFVSKEDL